MKRNSLVKSGMVLAVFSLLLLTACSSNMGTTFQHYARQPGFDLKIVRSDSLSDGPKSMSRMMRYLDGIQEVYVLTFDADSGNVRENSALYHHLMNQIADQNFENLFSVGGKRQLGLYAKKDEQGEVNQLLFLKTGGRHSVYVWAPKAADRVAH